jgi:hypothetical protein
MGANYEFTETALVSVILGIVVPLITMPLWQFSSLFGNGKNEIIGSKKKEENSFIDSKGNSMAILVKRNSLRIMRIEKELEFSDMSPEELKKKYGIN